MDTQDKPEDSPDPSKGESHEAREPKKNRLIFHTTNKKDRKTKHSDHYTVSWGTILLLVMILLVIAFLDSYAYNQDVYNQHVLQERKAILIDINGNGYTQHYISVDGVSFYITFDKNATVKPTSQTISYTTLEGNDLYGNKLLIEVSPAPEPPNTDPCGGLFSSSNQLGLAKILGKTYPICGQPSSGSLPQNNTVGIQFQSDVQWYSIVYKMVGPLPVDLNTVNTVSQSIIL